MKNKRMKLKYWISYFRQNPVKFVEFYLGCKLNWYQRSVILFLSLIGNIKNKLKYKAR